MPKETRLTGGPAAPSPSTFGSQPIQLTDPRFVAQTNVVNPANQYQALQNILGLGSQIAGQAIESQNLEIKGILSVDAAVKSKIENDRLELVRSRAEKDRLLNDKIALSVANAGATRETAEKNLDAPALTALREQQLLRANDPNLSAEERIAAITQASQAGVALKGLGTDKNLITALSDFTVKVADAKKSGNVSELTSLSNVAKQNYQAAVKAGDTDATAKWASAYAATSGDPKQLEEQNKAAAQKTMSMDDNKDHAADLVNLASLEQASNIAGVKDVMDGAAAALKNENPENVSSVNRWDSLFQNASAAHNRLLNTAEADAKQAEKNAGDAAAEYLGSVLLDAVNMLTRPENLGPEILNAKSGVIQQAAFDSLRDALPDEAKRLLLQGSPEEQKAAVHALNNAARAVVTAQTSQRNQINAMKASQARIATTTNLLKEGNIDDAVNLLGDMTPAAQSTALKTAATKAFPNGPLGIKDLLLAAKMAEASNPELARAGQAALKRAEKDLAAEEINHRYPSGEYRLNEDNAIVDVKTGALLSNPDVKKGWANTFNTTEEAKDWWMKWRGIQQNADGSFPELGALAPNYVKFIKDVVSDLSSSESSFKSSQIRQDKNAPFKVEAKARWEASDLKSYMDKGQISGLSLPEATSLLEASVSLLPDTPKQMLSAIADAVTDSNNATFATAFFRVYDPGSFPNVAEAIGSSRTFKIAHQASILYTLYSEQGVLTKEQIMAKVADFSRSQQEKSDTNRLPVPKALQDKLDAARVSVVTNVTNHFNVQYEKLNQLDQGLITDFADMSSSISDLPAADRDKFVIRMMSSVGYVSLNRADGLSDIVYNPQTINGRALPSTEDIKSAEFSLYLTSLAPAVATYMSTLPVIDTGVIKTVAISPDMIRSIEPAPTDFYTSKGFSPVRVTMKSGEVYEIDPEKSGISVTESQYRNYLSTPEFPAALKKYNFRNTNPFSLG